MRIVFGLGNPGEEYKETRHNIGFMAILRLAGLHGCQVDQFRFRSLTGEAMIEGEPVILAMPQTFMNGCGPSLKQILDDAGEDPDSALVIVDDFHLSLGKIRIRRGGSAGGHRGLISISEALGTDDYPRLRFGIGHYGSDEPIEFVLKNFSEPELKEVQTSIDVCVQAVEAWAGSGIDTAMNRFNQAKETHERDGAEKTL